jgi:hypothetical protein
VEKDHFLSLIKNYTSLTFEEATELTSLQVDYPYSQVVHNLAARAAHDNNTGLQEQLLHMSAIYTTDRAVLKSIMTASRAERVMPASSLAVLEKSVTATKPVEPAMELLKAEIPSSSVQESKSISVDFKPDQIDLSGEALRQDVIEEMRKLKINRHNFEVIMEEYEKAQLPDTKPAKKATKKIVDSADVLIEEIKTTKKKVAPEGKQKEQIEIIENFIKAKPRIAKNKPVEEPVSDDLAEKSLTYGDNIVSETLVEILLKQGKKDKAIEILKKLIWKFPQKKAYFAARIEDLKN